MSIFRRVMIGAACLSALTFAGAAAAQQRLGDGAMGALAGAGGEPLFGAANNGCCCSELRMRTRIAYPPRLLRRSG